MHPSQQQVSRDQLHVVTQLYSRPSRFNCLTVDNERHRRDSLSPTRNARILKKTDWERPKTKSYQSFCRMVVLKEELWSTKVEFMLQEDEVKSYERNRIVRRPSGLTGKLERILFVVHKNV